MKKNSNEKKPSGKYVVYNYRTFAKILKANNYSPVRATGSHNIWTHNITGKHISIPDNVNAMVARRIIKECGLVII